MTVVRAWMAREINLVTPQVGGSRNVHAAADQWQVEHRIGKAHVVCAFIVTEIIENGPGNYRHPRTRGSGVERDLLPRQVEAGPFDAPDALFGEREPGSNARSRSTAPIQPVGRAKERLRARLAHEAGIGKA